MTAVAGNKLVIKVSASPITSSADGSVLAGGDSANWDVNKENFQVTGFGDEWQQSMVGIKDLSTSISGTYDGDNEAQQLLKNEDYVYVAFFNAGIDAPGEAAKFVVNSFSRSYDVAGRQDFSAELQGAGGAPVDIS